MEIQTKIIFDSIDDDFIGSLRKQKFIDVDGEHHNIGEPERRAVTPLDMYLVENFIFGEDIPRGRNAPSHPIIEALNTLWTDDVKKAYAEKIALDDENMAVVRGDLEDSFIETVEALEESSIENI